MNSLTSRTFPQAFLILILLLLNISQASTNCYLPDGSIAPGAYRCDNSTTGHSTCCEIGSVCWSNGVCQKVDHGITDWIRLGCTDSTWNDDACLHACLQYNHTAIGVRPCGGMTGTSYCCDLKGGDPGGMQCCNNASDLFSVRAASVVAITVPGLSSTSASVVTTTVFGTSSSMTTSSLSSMSISEMSSSTGSTASSTSTAAATNSSGLSTGAKRGIGIGVALGAIAAALLGLFFFFRRRKNDKRYNTANTSPPEKEYAYSDGLKDPTQTQTPVYDHHGQGQMQQQAWSPMTGDTTGSSPAVGMGNARAPAELGEGHYHEIDSSRYR